MDAVLRGNDLLELEQVKALIYMYCKPSENNSVKTSAQATIAKDTE